MRIRIIVGVIAALILLTVGGILLHNYSQAQEVKEQTILGNKYLQEQKYEEAILALEKIIKIEPKNVEARIKLAKAYMGLNKNTEAEKVLMDALSITKKNPAVYLELARLYMKLDKVKEAVDILKTGYEETQDAEVKKLLDELLAPPSAPEASVKAGSYEFPQEVVLSSAGDAKIYYTLDNTTPTVNSNKYRDKITIETGKTVLRAIAVSKAGISSKESTYEYSVEVKPFNENDYKLSKIEYGMTMQKVMEVLGTPTNRRSDFEEMYNIQYTILDYSFGSFWFNNATSKMTSFKITSNDIAVGYRNIKIGDSVESVIAKYPHTGEIRYPNNKLYDIQKPDGTINFGRVEYDSNNNISSVGYGVGWADSEVAGSISYGIVNGKVSYIYFWVSG